MRRTYGRERERNNGKAFGISEHLNGQQATAIGSLLPLPYSLFVYYSPHESFLSGRLQDATYIYIEVGTDGPSLGRQNKVWLEVVSSVDIAGLLVYMREFMVRFWCRLQPWSVFSTRRFNAAELTQAQQMRQAGLLVSRTGRRRANRFVLIYTTS